MNKSLYMEAYEMQNAYNLVRLILISKECWFTVAKDVTT